MVTTAETRAYQLFQRKAAGKKISFHGESPAVFRAYQRLLEDRDYERAIEGAAAVKLAKHGGYTSPRAMVQLQEAAKVTKETEGRFQPIERHGKVVGFADVVAGQSIPISEFQKTGGYQYTVTKQIEQPAPFSEFLQSRYIAPATTLGKIKTGYYGAERWVSEKIPSMMELKQVQWGISGRIYGTSPEEMRRREIESLRKEFVSEEQYQRLPSWQRKLLVKTDVGYAPSYLWAGGELGRGIYTEWQQKPVKTATLTGAFAVAPYVIGKIGTSIGIGKITAAFPKTSAITGQVVKGTLVGGYVGVTGARVAKAEKRIFEFGRILGGEITPMAVGGYFGSKYIPRISGWWRTRGRTEIPIEKLTPKEVIMGKERFPVAPREEHYGLFMGGKYRLPGYERFAAGYHAYPQPWRTLTVGKGTSEFPGVYIAHGVSPHFLKISQRYSWYGGKLFSPYGKPGAMYVIPKGFVKGYKAPTGYAFVPGVKREVEAVIPPSTQLMKIGQKYYFKWRGVRVPIDVFRAKAGLGVGTKTFSKLAYSYRFPTSYAITTPGSYALGSAYSLSKLKSSISPISKLSRSPIFRYYKSGISYKPPSYKAISYKQRYKSYFPSYTSYAISYKPYKPSYPKYKRPPPPPPPWFPKFPKMKGRRIGLFRKVKQPQAYMPSLTGAVLRVKGRARPLFKKFHLGYLPGIRGIRRKKKKRR